MVLHFVIHIFWLSLALLQTRESKYLFVLWSENRSNFEFILIIPQSAKISIQSFSLVDLFQFPFVLFASFKFFWYNKWVTSFNYLLVISRAFFCYFHLSLIGASRLWFQVSWFIFFWFSLVMQQQFESKHLFVLLSESRNNFEFISVIS